MGEAKRRKEIDPNYGKQGSKKIKIKVVDIGRSGSAEYKVFDSKEIDSFKKTILVALASNFMPTADDFVEIVFGASLACWYWRTDFTFEDAMQQVIRDIQRNVERG